MSVRFRKTKESELWIDAYLDLVANAGLLFKGGLRLYLRDRPSEFQERLSGS